MAPNLFKHSDPSDDSDFETDSGRKNVLPKRKLVASISSDDEDFEIDNKRNLNNIVVGSHKKAKTSDIIIRNTFKNTNSTVRTKTSPQFSTNFSSKTDGNSQKILYVFKKRVIVLKY